MLPILPNEYGWRPDLRHVPERFAKDEYITSGQLYKDIHAYLTRDREVDRRGMLAGCGGVPDSVWMRFSRNGYRRDDKYIYKNGVPLLKIKRQYSDKTGNEIRPRLLWEEDK